MAEARRTILCLSSAFKGNTFFRRCRRDGARVFLLTLQSLREEAWARDALDDLFVMPSFADRRAVLGGVAYLLRGQPVDRLVALDEGDGALAASLREHFRLPGPGKSAARLLRDRLAMRLRARECGVRVADFVAVIHHDEVRRFLAEAPPPWLLGPRLEPSPIGSRPFDDADEVWRRLDELGDDQSFHLLEALVPGEVYHVDALAAGGRVVFAEAGEYLRPPREVWHQGGVLASRTVPRDLPLATELREANARLLAALGFEWGAAHTEFVRSRADGGLSFLQTAARVAGAGVAEMVEAATGLDLWQEWAAVEVAGDGYTLPPTRAEYAGRVVSLARQERPDTSAYKDPEIVARLDGKHTVGLVVRSRDSGRVDDLLASYTRRIGRDFQAVLPPPARPRR
jgi:hypothetical protein